VGMMILSFLASEVGENGQGEACCCGGGRGASGWSRKIILDRVIFFGRVLW